MLYTLFTPWLVAIAWVGFLANTFGLLPWWVAAGACWMAFALIWSGLNRNAKLQAGILFVVGVITLVFAFSQGAELRFRDIAAINVPLLAMFVAISFLSLTADETAAKSLPKGKKTMINTALGMHLLGSVINLSVLFIFGDRLQRKGRLTSHQQVVFGRCFCAAAWWSPFFVATGVALTYSPEMQWKATLIPGLLMAMLAIAFTVFELSRKPDITEFEGYPIRAESLVMPVVLAVSVIVAHELFPNVSVVILICVLAPLGTLLFMKERPRGRSIVGFIQQKMTNVGGQFALFLAAGVFSSGIKSLVLVYPEVFDLSGYNLDGWLYFAISGVMIAIGLVGVHPIVSIAVVSPLLLPLQPDPNQLAFLFVTSWAVSTASSPLSGFGLTLVSRYQAESMGIIRNNWHYAVLMWLLSSVLAVAIF